MNTSDFCGYLYIIETHSVYKIGCTSRHPPHSRLWEYPIGAVFLGIYPVKSNINANHLMNLESEWKRRLQNHTELTQRLDLGVEYYQGSLNIIGQLLPDEVKINVSHSTACDTLNLNVESIRKLNRFNYFISKPPQVSLSFEASTSLPLPRYDVNQLISTDVVYKTYQNRRKFNQNWPVDYVMRVGFIAHPYKVPKYSVKQRI
jgi:hypothetical protein